MGERRLVHELVHTHGGTAGVAGGEQLRRLVAHRERVAALLRAGRRVEPPVAAAAYRSSYAARLWELSEAAEPAEPAGRQGHLALVGEDEDMF
jgi:hypothetical protein